MKNFILGISNRGDSRIPFFVLPDGIIRTFTEGWALLSYVLDIDPARIITREEISSCSEGVITYGYHYVINDEMEVVLELPSDIDLDEMENRVKKIIYDIKKNMDAENISIIEIIKDRLREVSDIATNIVQLE